LYVFYWLLFPPLFGMEVVGGSTAPPLILGPDIIGCDRLGEGEGAGYTQS